MFHLKNSTFLVLKNRNDINIFATKRERIDSGKTMENNALEQSN